MPTRTQPCGFFSGAGLDLWVPKWEDVYDTFVDLRKKFPRVAKQCLVLFFLCVCEKDTDPNYVYILCIENGLEGYLINMVLLKNIYFHFYNYAVYFIFNIFILPQGHVHWFLERGEGREKNMDVRENRPAAPYPQPKHVPWPGIEPERHSGFGMMLNQPSRTG